MTVEIRRVAISGDSPVTAMVGVALALSLRNSGVRVTIVNDARPATPVAAFRGGETSLHSVLGIDGAVLRDITSISLGARYIDVLPKQPDAFVPLGGHGKTLRLVDFHHYIVKLRAAGEAVAYNDYSVPAACAAAGRLVMPGRQHAALRNTVDFDHHVSSEDYADRMLAVAREAGGEIVSGRVIGAEHRDETMIDALVLENGDRVLADLFIDCSRHRVIADSAGSKAEFDDWSDWLPYNGIDWSPCSQADAPGPCSVVTTTRQGWKLFLRTRTRAFSAELSRDAGAVNGNYRAHWVGNCIAMGAAATRLEPIEVSPMHLAEAAVRQLMTMLPRRADSHALMDEFNRIMRAKSEDARDYVALRHAAIDPAYRVPASLDARLQLFRARGRFTRAEIALINKSRWVSSFLNLGIWPEAHDPIADMVDEARMREDLARFRERIASLVQSQTAPHA